MIKTILVEDDIEMLEGLMVIDWEAYDFSIVATARNGASALALIEEKMPDVIITDITMPVMGGLELLRKAKKICPKIKSIIISCHEEFEYAREAMRLQADEYLLKHTLTQDSLIQAISKLKESISNEAKQLQNYYGIDLSTEISSEQSYHLAELANLYEIHAPILKEAIKNKEALGLMQGAKAFLDEIEGKYHPAPCKAILSRLLIELALTMPNSGGISVEALQLKYGDRAFLDTIRLMAEKLAAQAHNTTNDNVLKAIAYIEKHLCADISCKAVAAHIHMNSSYFSRLFSKELGVSFSDFVLQKRIEKATALLSNTKYSIDEIAAMVGIESVSYFYRIYKRMTGNTPGDARSKSNMYNKCH